MKRFLLLIIIACMVMLPGCSTGNSEADAPIIVMLDWVVNTNHAGLYMALEKGFFDEEGINVEIRERGQDASLVVVGQGRADFGISAQEQVTFSRVAENPQPVVAVAAILQRNTTAFVSLANEDINTPKDFEGKVYGHNNMPTDMPIIDALMRLNGADPAQLTNVALGVADAFAALESEIDIIKIFRGWAGIQAELREIPLNYIMIGEADERFDIYTPIIISNESYLEANPEKAKKFLTAVSRGYEFAAKNPTEAAELLHKYAPESDIALLNRSLLYLSGFYLDDHDRFGYMCEDVWINFSDFCIENGIIDTALDVNAAYTNEYLS